MEVVCLECGAEMPYDWAPCPHCGWKAPSTDYYESASAIVALGLKPRAAEPWEAGDEDGPSLEESPGILSKPRRWIGATVWILLGLLLLGSALTFWWHA